MRKFILCIAAVLTAAELLQVPRSRDLWMLALAFYLIWLGVLWLATAKFPQPGVANFAILLLLPSALVMVLRILNNSFRELDSQVGALLILLAVIVLVWFGPKVWRRM